MFIYVDIPKDLSPARVEKALKAEFGCKPKYHKGHYGKRYEYWTCGNCGARTKDTVLDNYCWNCGYRIIWDSCRCMTGWSATEHADEGGLAPAT